MVHASIRERQVRSILLIGGSRGLGAALKDELLKDAQVHWTTRKRPKAAGRYAHQLDLADALSIEMFARELDDLSFDEVIFCAAMTDIGYSEGHEVLGGDIDTETFQQVMQVNCFAPLRIAQLLLASEKLNKGARLFFISSAAGSIGLRGEMPHHRPGGPALYRISKAALNCGVRNLAFDLRSAGVTAVALHPGWVRTNDQTSNANASAASASKSLVALMKKISPKDSGRFFNHEGDEIQW